MDPKLGEFIVSAAAGSAYELTTVLSLNDV